MNPHRATAPSQTIHPRLQINESDASMTIKAYGAHAADKPLEPIDIERRAAGPARCADRDRLLRRLPFRPAHRALRMGRARCIPACRATRSSATSAAVGSEVTGFKVGDTVGVGCLVDSCQHCASCAEGLEQYCENGFTGTYNGPTRMRRATRSAAIRSGSWSTRSFVLQDPPSRGAARRRRAAAVRRHHHLFAAAPLEGRARHRRSASSASAGSATWASSSPTRWARTWSRSPPRRASARTRWHLGADEVVVSRNARRDGARMPAASTSSSTPSRASHDLDAFTALLKRDGTHVPGRRPRACRIRRRTSFNLIFKRRSDRRLADRRHRRDAGDARFLRRARHRRRHRDDPRRRRSTRPTSAC